MALELKQERPRVGAELGISVGLQDQLVEAFGVEKVLIHLTSPRSIAGVLCVGRDGQLLPHLETHVEVFGDLRQVAGELIRGWRAVEGGVITQNQSH